MMSRQTHYVLNIRLGVHDSEEWYHIKPRWQFAWLQKRNQFRQEILPHIEARILGVSYIQ